LETATRPPSWKILLAFGIIYFVWGSTFLAIRVGVNEVPPFLLAGIRFFVSGIVLYGWMRLKGAPSPSRPEWTSAMLLGALIFLVDYGCLFWAEQRVPSGIAAVVLATIPVFITLLEIIFLRTQRLTVRLGLALLAGLCGVAVLTLPSFSFGEVPINRAGALALLVAAFTWSVATILTRRLTLPASKPMSAAAQMLAGGAQLFALAALSGEFAGFHVHAVSAKAWFARLYLIVAPP
jgi:drug/metabolite transporter (DMT)-like permease